METDSSSSFPTISETMLLPHLRKLADFSTRSLPNEDDYDVLTDSIDGILNVIPSAILLALTPESKKLRSVLYRTIPHEWFVHQFVQSNLTKTGIEKTAESSSSPSVPVINRSEEGRSKSTVDIFSILPAIQRLFKLLDIFVRDNDIGKDVYQRYGEYVGKIFNVFLVHTTNDNGSINNTDEDTDIPMHAVVTTNESLVACYAVGLRIIASFVNNSLVSGTGITSSSSKSSEPSSYGVYSVNLLILLSRLLGQFASLPSVPNPSLSSLSSSSSSFSSSLSSSSPAVGTAGFAFVLATFRTLFQRHENMYLSNALDTTASFASSDKRRSSLSSVHPTVPPNLYQGLFTGGGDFLLRILQNKTLPSSFVTDTLHLLYRWLHSIYLIYPSLATDLPKTYQKEWKNAGWIYTLREVLIQNISEPLPWTTTTSPKQGNDATTDSSSTSSYTIAKKIQSLRILSLGLSVFGTVWLLSDSPWRSTVKTEHTNVSTNGYKFTLLLVRLLGAEIKLCIDDIEDLVVLSSAPSTIEVAYGHQQQQQTTVKTKEERKEDTGSRTSPWISSLSKRTLTRNERTHLLHQRYSALQHIYCYAIDIYTKIIRLLSSLPVSTGTGKEENTAKNTPSTGTPKTTTFPYNLSSALLVPLHEALAPITGILITFLNDTFTSSELRLVLNVLSSVPQFTVPSISLANLPSSTAGTIRLKNEEMIKREEEEDYLSLGWRCRVFEFFAAVTTNGIGTYLTEDTEAFRDEFIDVLPLMLQVSTRTRIGAPDLVSLIGIAKEVNDGNAKESTNRIEYLPLPVMMDHPLQTLLPVIIDRLDSSTVRNHLGMDLVSSCGNVWKSLLDTGIELVRSYGRTMTLATMAADDIEKTKVRKMRKQGTKREEGIEENESSSLVSIASPFRSGTVDNYTTLIDHLIDFMMDTPVASEERIMDTVLCRATRYYFDNVLGMERLLPLFKDMRSIASRCGNTKVQTLAYALGGTKRERLYRLSRRYVGLTAILFRELGTVGKPNRTIDMEGMFGNLRITGNGRMDADGGDNGTKKEKGFILTKELCGTYREELKDITYDIFHEGVKLEGDIGEEGDDAEGKRKEEGRDQYLFHIVLDCLEVEGEHH